MNDDRIPWLPIAFAAACAFGVGFYARGAARPVVEVRDRIVEKRVEVAVEKERETKVADVAVRKDVEVVTRWLPAPGCKGGVIVERVERDKTARDSKVDVKRESETKREARTEVVTLRETKLVQPRLSLGLGPSWSSLQARPTGAVVAGGVRLGGPVWLDVQAGYDNGVKGALMLRVQW